MSRALTIPLDNQTVNPALSDSHEPVRMETIAQIAAMIEGEERPAFIWGNTDRATIAAEALWVFAKRTGLEAKNEDACTPVQDLIASLMHLCEQEGITGGDVTFASIVSTAEMHYLEELNEGH